MDSYLQEVVPVLLRKCFFSAAHQPKRVRYPGEGRMYNTTQRDDYWPHKANDVYEMAGRFKASPILSENTKQKQNLHPFLLHSSNVL